MQKVVGSSPIIRFFFFIIVAGNKPSRDIAPLETAVWHTADFPHDRVTARDTYARWSQAETSGISNPSTLTHTLDPYRTGD